ncbi:acetyl acetyltransferase [Fusarium beomiforme]|uniref:Acetyl acetyltransferase n=1 Tax=Fusarium beomiforme TaxID=44412 RepID=A0A9P5A6R0_9HYPO|nr:acetyl acetyltransferase [Fusarium beomiforme]
MITSPNIPKRAGNFRLILGSVGKAWEPPGTLGEKLRRKTLDLETTPPHVSSAAGAAATPIDFPIEPAASVSILSEHIRTIKDQNTILKLKGDFAVVVLIHSEVSGLNGRHSAARSCSMIHSAQTTLSYI